MPVSKPVPEPAGEVRRANAKSRRDAATSLAHNRFHPPLMPGGGRTEANGEEVLYEDTYCTNFRKGLEHDDFGLLVDTAHYETLVDGINQESDTRGVAPGESWFEKNITVPGSGVFHCQIDNGSGTLSNAEWRGWESPRSGHAYDLEGSDSEALCMPPAPRLSSPELHVEVAEVYALALLRDVPFSEFSTVTASSGSTSVKSFGVAIGNMPWFAASHTPANGRESARRSARGINPGNHQSLFRGSAFGAKDGPYISQFLLTGSAGRTGVSSEDGHIFYGTQIIDQRNFVHSPDIDYMTEWEAWRDVQNGARFNGSDQFLPRRRFISTPRDLATYVHFDELYQSYFNAALLLNGHLRVPFDVGLPSGSRTGYLKDDGIIKRDSFATFGGPHLLGLLTEVSTRALRAVRRQKFNYHRRARPEVMGWIASLAASDESSRLGAAEPHAQAMLDALPEEIKNAIQSRNEFLNHTDRQALRSVKCSDGNPAWLSENLLLPMAFPEGSPMHPAYGAGHATVAGACVTILKAYFQLRSTDGVALPFSVAGSSTTDIFEADATAGSGISSNESDWGESLRVMAASEIVDETGTPTELTIEGELNKLAANIAIGRNMAGVHFYTDYYDSLRLGERIAVGILQEQMSNYPDAVSMTFWDFDKNKIEIRGSGDANAMVMVEEQPAGDAWWACEVGEATEEPVTPPLHA